MIIDGFIEIGEDVYEELEGDGDYEVLKVEHYMIGECSPHIRYFTKIIASTSSDKGEKK